MLKMFRIVFFFIFFDFETKLKVLPEIKPPLKRFKDTDSLKICLCNFSVMFTTENEIICIS